MKLFFVLQPLAMPFGFYTNILSYRDVTLVAGSGREMACKRSEHRLSSFAQYILETAHSSDDVEMTFKPSGRHPYSFLFFSLFSLFISPNWIMVPK